jgi:hypothetical protein
VLLSAVMGWACADSPTGTAVRAPSADLKTERLSDELVTTQWNQRATDLLQQLPAPPNGQAWASRMLTYLSLAQYRAVLAATAPSERRTHVSVSAAVSRASVTVLRAFFATAPGVPDALAQQLAADRSVPGWPGKAKEDVAAGDAIGLAVATAVLAQSEHDGYLTAPAAFADMVRARGVRPNDWYPAPGAIVRSLWGVTPFFLGPEDFLLSPDPPTYDSPAFQTALAEVYAMVSSGTPEQLAERLRIALFWNKVPPNGPFTAGEWNRTADELIRSHHRTEAKAARILAYANAAAFDAQIDCFVTKYTWWVRRPAQVNSSITTAFATPNHPSYPSGHSCISSAFGAVLSDAFPSERSRLDALVEEAGMSRIYAGIHYRFDIEAGQGVGRRAAAKALAGSLE